MENCVFCSIVKDNIPHHEIIWSDDDHIAFLALHPSKEGHTLVIPKAHSIGILDLSSSAYAALFEAARVVGIILQNKLDCVRVCIVTEGASIPHTHGHLIPLKVGEQLASFNNESKTREELAAIAQWIRRL